MATIYNSQLSKELQDGAKIQINRDVIPNQLAEKVVPVMEVNPKLLRRVDYVLTGSRATTGGVTLDTTKTNADTYIVGGTLSFSKNAACDGASGEIVFISAVINGQTIKFANMAGTVTTEENGSVAFSMPFPMKVDRGSQILLNGAGFTAGVRSIAASVYGYIDYAIGA